MNDAEDQREAELADFLAEARTSFQSGRIPDLSTWQSRYPDEVGEMIGLLKTVQDLDTLLNDRPVSATMDYVASRQAGEGTPVPCPLPKQIGRYRILAWIGSGGMGTVYRAHDPHLEREVALKVPRLEPFGEDPALAVQRFLREARAAAGVRHPHVCPIYDAGEHAGIPYVVMAFIAGHNLTALLQPDGLDPRRASALVSKVALGLEAVHALGIIHRDLKPGNILLDAAGEPLVTDFGLACLGQEQKPLTAYGVLLGTPGYMAPEQVSPQVGALGPWTDIYSLGVVLYQLLCGRTPFAGSGLTLLYQIAHEKPPPPSQFRADLDPALEAIVLKTLAPRPEDRFASAAQFSEALQGWLRGELPIENRHAPAGAVSAKTAPLTVRTELPGGGAVTLTLEGACKMPAQLQVTVEQQQVTARKRRRKLRIKITLALSLLLLPVAGFLALRSPIVSDGEDVDPKHKRLAKAKEKARILTNLAKSSEVQAYLERALAIQHLAQTLSTQGKGAEAALLLEKVLAAKEKGLPDPANSQVQAELAKTYFLLGAISRENGQLQKSDEAYKAALTLQQKLVANFPARADYRLQLASGYNNLGSVASLQGKQAEAEAAYKEAENLATQLVHDFKNSAKTSAISVADFMARLRECNEALAVSYTNLGTVHQKQGDLESARKYGQLAQKIWSDLGVKEIFAIKVPPGDARNVAFSPDGTLLASGSKDQTVILWDMATGKKKLSLKGPTSPITRLAFSPDGKRLVTASLDRKLRLWDAATGRELLTLPGHTQAVMSVAFSPDGKFIAGGAKDKEVKVWDAQSGNQVLSRPGNGGTMAELLYSADGKCLASGSEDGTTGLWDVASGKAVLSFKEETGPVKSVAFNSRSNLLARVSKEGVKFWNTASRKEVQLLRGHQSQVAQVAISADGKLLATVTAYGLVKLWNGLTGQEIMSVPAGKVSQVVLSPDGRHLACIAEDGAVHVWNIAPAQPKP